MSQRKVAVYRCHGWAYSRDDTFCTICEKPWVAECFDWECPQIEEQVTHDGALRAAFVHLRTEHADLFERCEECLGKGFIAWVHWSNRWACTDCNGRGWTWKED